jgi:hypothetical protein
MLYVKLHKERLSWRYRLGAFLMRLGARVAKAQYVEYDGAVTDGHD